MAKIADIEDCKQALIAQQVIIEHLSVALVELKGIVADHIKGHASTWYWIIPTFLLLVQIVVTLVLLSRGG